MRIWILDSGSGSVLQDLLNFFKKAEFFIFFCLIFSFIFIQLFEDLVSSYGCIDGSLSGKAKNRTTDNIISCKMWAFREFVFKF